MENAKYFTYSMFNSNIHLVQINNVRPLNGAFEEYLQFSDRSAKELKGAMIIDISKGKFLSPRQLTKLSDVINSNNEAIAKNWTSVAYINTSIIARIMLKGRLRMRPLPVKANVFTSLDDAVTWSYKIFLKAEDQH
ncbi:MAG TPA: hypothetical protein VGQ59_15960 [Cyclobacteriaceae bacterium]|jgi:hypothetical protein|nr:hypothetical protein [Cyclobacteriaceae bacterium]